MRRTGRLNHNVQNRVERLRRLPFVQDATLLPALTPQADPRLQLKTEAGTFLLQVEFKETKLGTMILADLLARAGSTKGADRILFTRHVTRPMAIALDQAGINYVDRAGNLRLALGRQYYASVTGQPDTSVARPKQPTGGSNFARLLFQFLIEPKSVEMPLRTLATHAGIGKTAADVGRRKLLQAAILVTVAEAPGRERFRLLNREELAGMALHNYGAVLRPRLLLGRYRAQEKDPEVFLAALARYMRHAHPEQWGLTGSAAAWTLQQYYRGEATTAFIPEVTPEMQRTLRLVPDAGGPITFLRHYAPNLTRDRNSGIRTAHPWLIYAELLYEGTPRALEAAERLRQEYLA